MKQCASGSSAPAVAVERIVVGRSKIAFTVVLAPGTPHFMTPHYATHLIEQVPSLPRHACVNSTGPHFGDVIDSTSIPHVLEHLVVDGQCAQRGAAPDDFLFIGTTEWIDEPAGRAHVEVNYADDLVALRSLRDSLAILNGLLEGK